MWVERSLSHKINQLSRSRPVILVTGARQVGKSSLLKCLFPEAEYVTLDRVRIAEYAESNPEQFLGDFTGPVILDEMQYAPSLFRELKILVDERRQTYGQWILSGSQRYALMNEVSESLAGRIAIIPLETLSASELSPYVTQDQLLALPWLGGYPELWSNSELARSDFFDGYIQTYLERDLKSLINVSSLRDFQQFIRALSVRVGQLINYADVAKDVGVSQVTIKNWFQALQAGGLIMTLQPYYRNLGKRLIKRSKFYFCDTGLLSYLLGIEHKDDYRKHPYQGQIWENFVFTELIKTHGLVANKNLFFYRDQNAVEVDFVIEYGGATHLIKAKLSEKVDIRKLNFDKVSPLFSGPVKNYVANSINESRVIAHRSVSLFNPALCYSVF